MIVFVRIDLACVHFDICIFLSVNQIRGYVWGIEIFLQKNFRLEALRFCEANGDMPGSSYCRYYIYRYFSYTIWTRWAPERRLALWFAVVNSSFGVAATLSFLIVPFLAQISVPLAIWVSYIAPLLLLFSSLFMTLIDYHERDRFDDSIPKPTILSWNSIQRIKLPLWILVVTIVVYFSSLFTFFTVASDIFQNTGFYNPPEIASSFIAISNAVKIFMGPYFGWFYDHHGRALTFILVGALSTAISYICLLGNAYGIIHVSYYWERTFSVFFHIESCCSIHT